MKQSLHALGVLFLCIGGLHAQVKDNGQPALAKETTLVTEKAGETLGNYCGYSLSAIGALDNSNAGVMFDITALQPVTISAFTVNLIDNFTGKVYIYSKFGTHVGFESSSASWNLIDSTVVNNASGMTYIPVSVDLSLANGTTAAFYIRGELSTSLKYSNGTTLGAELANDGNISLKEGSGINGNFASSYSPRDFEGIVHYCKTATVVCDTITSVFNNENGNTGIFFDIATQSHAVTINQIFADFSATSGSSFPIQLYSRNGSHLGFESSSLGWTLIVQDTVFAPEFNTPSAISTGISENIPANSVKGFYLICPGNTVDYSNSINAVGTPFLSDANIEVRSGTGSADLFTGSLFQGRDIHAVIDYCVISGVGIESLPANSLTVAPNPVSNVLSLQSETTFSGLVRIIDLTGKEHFMQLIDADTDQLSVDVSTLASGSYLIQTTQSDRLVQTLFVKQ